MAAPLQRQGPRRLDAQDHGLRARRELRRHLPRRERRPEGRATTSTRTSTASSATSSTRRSSPTTGCRVEYRFVGEQCQGGPGWAIRNSGVMFHCQAPETMRKDQDFPVSIEVQFLGGRGKGKRPTANMCTPGTNVVMNGKLFTPHCINSKSKTYDGDQWVTAEIEVHGGGKRQAPRERRDGAGVREAAARPARTRTAKKLHQGREAAAQEGYIALQAESHPCEFRKVEIKVLKK